MSLRPLIVLCLALATACGAAPPAAPPPKAGAPTAAKPKPADPLDEPLPLDARLTKGRLDSGLTYYVLPHKKPEKRAQVWLAVNAGSVLEDEDQQGLAHFVEHMGFNGTKRFPKQELVDFLEKSGVRFGADSQRLHLVRRDRVHAPSSNGQARPLAALLQRAARLGRRHDLRSRRGREGAGSGAGGMATGSRRRQATVRQASSGAVPRFDVRQAPDHR